MQRLYVAAHLPEAHLVRGLLAAAGIVVRIFNEYSPGAGGELPLTEVAPELWLEDERDLAPARRVIESYERSTVASDDRRCPSCGEDNPGSFAVCWRCQRPL